MAVNSMPSRLALLYTFKDKTGNESNVNNYRGIPLMPVFSKLFELVLLEICEQFLSCDELLFGYLKRSWMFRNNFYTS